ncbi:HEAT repeat domain-containing protein [Caulobacter endophyticus]|uniref:HEAT repeat domain-containing protein n=1 Tax=Caulobacter endophyticus TaxID=2172652 RepID=UPI002410AEAE|nr:HEAT repeat domain-containing protein [Caulobacter endophyticus]MDG2527327.1 HEAT repeat domain-containing protein [Caulobacter endophyticus]
MSTLTLIWVVALVLIGAALAWMTALIVARFVKEARASDRAADRKVIIQSLSGLLRGQPDVAATLSPFVQRPEVLAEAILDFQGLIRGADQERAMSALKALGLVEALEQRIAHGSRDERLTSVEALAALGGEEVRAALRRAIRSKDPNVRMAAIKGLADAGSPPTPSRLLDYVGTGELTPSRVYAEMMRQAVAAAPADGLLALQRQDLDPLMRGIVLDALGRSGSYEAVPALAAAAADPDPNVRTAAVRGLGRLQHPAAAPPLAAALSDPAWTVRSAGAEAVGAAGLARLAPQVAALLDDPEWWVRFRAGDALRRLGRPGLNHLETVAADDTRPVAQRAAERALAEGG